MKLALAGRGDKAPIVPWLGQRGGGAHPAQASPGQSPRQGTRSALRQGRGCAGKAWTRPRFGSRAEQAPGGRLRDSRRARRPGGSGKPRREERGRAEEGVRERACVRARVCAHPAPARVRALPLPAPRPLPAAPSPPPPAPRSRPTPGISAAVAEQAADSSSPSLCRLSARSERAAPRSSAHRSRPVSPGPSRGQPRGVASRPTRPAAEEREEDGTPAPPPPYPREVGRGPEAGRCQLTGAVSRAGSWAAGGGARAQAGRTRLSRLCPAPGERGGGGEAVQPGQWRRGEPGLQWLLSTRAVRGGGRRAVGSAVRRSQSSRAHRGRPASSVDALGPIPSPPPPPPPSSRAQRPPARGWLRSGQTGGCIFGCPLSSPGWWRAGAVLTGPGSARNGTGDAARRGPGCAALQLKRRRRPGAPTPAHPRARPPPSLPSPLSQGWAGAASGRGAAAAPALQLLPPSLQQVCASAGTLRACLWGSGLEAPLVISPHTTPAALFLGGAFPLFL